MNCELYLVGLLSFISGVTKTSLNYYARVYLKNYGPGNWSGPSKDGDISIWPSVKMRVPTKTTRLVIRGVETIHSEPYRYIHHMYLLYILIYSHYVVVSISFILSLIHERFPF